MKILIGLVIGFVAGVVVTMLLVSVGLRSGPTVASTPADADRPTTISAVNPPLAPIVLPVAPVPSALLPSDVAPVTPVVADAAVDELRGRRLEIPVRGVAPTALQATYNDPRGADRTHHGIDILAPRNTPVLAAEDGVIAKLFASVQGGLTIYQFDPGTRYTYYYAHLERYADGLVDGLRVTRGQVLGYVGTSGNAPKDTPHLHFEIAILTDARQWWKATTIDPYRVLR